MCMYMCIHMCVYVYAYVYVFMYMYVCILSIRMEAPQGEGFFPSAFTTVHPAPRKLPGT